MLEWPGFIQWGLTPIPPEAKALQILIAFRRWISCLKFSRPTGHRWAPLPRRPPRAEAPCGAPKTASPRFLEVGGTGAFLGARGQAATIMNTHRSTSTLENPINRRTFPAGLWKLVVQVIPMRTPEVGLTTTGPAIVHSSDFSLVTAAKPARAGEVLTLFASGLGPTRPGVDPGQAFTASPAQIVSSPIDVLVNGKAGEVLYSGGYPNTVDNYPVNFRMPDGVTSGLASVQLSAAWVVGAEVKISVQ